MDTRKKIKLIGILDIIIGIIALLGFIVSISFIVIGFTALGDSGSAGWAAPFVIGLGIIGVVFSLPLIFAIQIGCLTLKLKPKGRKWNLFFIVPILLIIFLVSYPKTFADNIIAYFLPLIPITIAGILFMSLVGRSVVKLFSEEHSTKVINSNEIYEKHKISKKKKSLLGIKILGLLFILTAPFSVFYFKLYSAGIIEICLYFFMPILVGVGLLFVKNWERSVSIFVFKFKENIKKLIDRKVNRRQ